MGTALAFGAVHADERERQGDILAYGEIGKKVERLEDEAHVASAPQREGFVVADMIETVELPRFNRGRHYRHRKLFDIRFH